MAKPTETEKNQVAASIKYAKALLSDPRTEDKDKPWIEKSILSAQTALDFANFGNDIDLSAYTEPRKLLQSGLLREQRQSQIETIQATLEDQRKQELSLREELASDVISPERTDEINQMLQSLQQEISTTSANLQSLYLTSDASLSRKKAPPVRLTPKAEINLNYKNLSAEANRIYLAADNNENPISYEEAEEQAREKLQQVLGRKVLDTAGDPAMTSVREPSENVDFATGTIFNPETGKYEPASFLQLASQVARPQILATSEPEYFNQERVYKYPKPVQPSSPSSLLQPKEFSLDDKDIIVEPPTTGIFRLVGAAASAATGIFADTFTYTIDDQGNPVRPDDIAAMIALNDPLQFRIPYTNTTVRPFTYMFQPVESNRDWAHATTMSNVALSAAANGLTFYEVKKAAPNLNPYDMYVDEIDTGFGDFADGIVKGYLYSIDTAIGLTSVVADMLMPLDPVVYVTKPLKGMRAASKSMSGGMGLVGEVANSKTIDKALKLYDNAEALTSASIGRGIYNATVNRPINKAYQYELNILIDDALQDGVTPNIPLSNISNMQQVASREVSNSLTELSMYRIKNYPLRPEGLRRFADEIIDENSYVAWSKNARSIDNPIKVPISIAELIVNDVRSIKALRYGETATKATLYGSAFRSNLVRAGVKRPKYRGKLLESYKFNYPNAVPDMFYQRLVNDSDVLEEAISKTLRDALSDELFSRLPVNQIMVTANRIVPVGQLSDANRQAVSTLYTQNISHKIQDDLFYLDGDSTKNIDNFISGAGLDEIRSSEQLRAIIGKIDRGKGLSRVEFAIYQDAIMGHAWDTVIAESRMPVVMSNNAYMEASQYSRNSVVQSRARVLGREYALQIMKSSKGRPMLKPARFLFKPATMVKTHKKLLEDGIDITLQRAYLSTVKVADDAISKTPVPYLKLKERIDALRSTAFESMINDIKNLTKQHKDGTIALNILLTEAYEQQIKISSIQYRNKFEREYSHLATTMDKAAAEEQAFERALDGISMTRRVDGDGKVITISALNTQQKLNLLNDIIIEETTYKLTSDFFEKFWFTGMSGEATRQAPNIIRDYAKEIARDRGGTGLEFTTKSLQDLELKLLRKIPALKNVRSKTKSNTLAWADTFIIYTLSLRGSTLLKSGIEEIMIRYPSIYMDMVINPIQKLNRFTDAERLTQIAKQQMLVGITGKEFPVVSVGGRELLNTFLENKDLHTYFMEHSTKKQNLKSIPRSVLQAKEDFQNQIASLFRTPNETEQKNIFRAFRSLHDDLYNVSQKGLLLNSKERFGLSTSMIQGMAKSYVVEGRELFSFIDIADQLDLPALRNMQVHLNELVELLTSGRGNPKGKATLNGTLYRIATSNTLGLNGSYSGNLSDLMLPIQLKTNQNSFASMAIIESEIDSALRSYGVAFGPPSEEISLSLQKISPAEQILNIYRPRIELIDTEGIALFLGREIADDFIRLQQKATGQDWKQILENYRAYTDAVNKGTLGQLNKDNSVLSLIDTATRMSTTGLLGGFVAPNMRYLGVNFFSAPLLMASDLGLFGTLSSLQWMGADLKFLRGNWKPDDIFMVTKNGESITYGQYAKLVSTENIATTFSASQFQKTSMDELLRALALDSEMNKISGAKQLMRWMDPRQRTLFTMWSHHSDMVFRRAVFSKGLADGKTPSQAATLSRTALLDYGKARSTALGKVGGATIQFWSFQIESMKAVLKGLLRGKSGALRIIRTQEGYNKQQEAYFVGNSREHARMFRYITKNGIGKDEMVGGFYNPAYESLSLIIEGFALVTAFGLETMSEQDEYNHRVQQLIEKIIERKPFMPSVNLFFGLIQNYSPIGKRNPEDSSRYLPPAYLPIVANDTLVSRKFKEVFKLSPVASREFDPTYRGSSYKFDDATAEQEFYLFEQTIFIIGAQRRFLDALKTQEITNVVQTTNLGTKTAFDRGYYGSVQRYLRQQGLESPMGLMISSAILYEAGLISSLRQDTPEMLFIREETRRRQVKEARKPTK
jgi:hypothetical protein